jgi:hypothetical protein
MTLWEMTRRIAADDYGFDGSNAEGNGLCDELKDQRVLFIVVRTSSYEQLHTRNSSDSIC